MPLHHSFLQFILKHPLALLTSLLIHSSIGFSFWYSTLDSSTLATNLSHLEKKTEKILPPATPKKEQEKTIQAESVNAKEIEKQIELLKKQRKAKTAAEQAKLKHIKKKQKELKQTEKDIAKQQKELTATRKKEEASIAKLKKQKDELSQQQKALLAKTTEEQKKLKAQEKKSQTLQKNLQVIRQEEKKVAERLDNLQAQTQNAKQANKQAIKDALKQQRDLEAKRIKEQLRIEQAKQTQARLKREQQKATENLQKLAQQQEQTSSKLAASQRNKEKLEKATEQQISLLKKQYINAIRLSVRAKWRSPVSTSNDWKCEISVTQTTKGEVTDVTLKNCSKDASQRFKESVKKAVFRADPLPSPPDIRVFDENITFIFKP